MSPAMMRPTSGCARGEWEDGDDGEVGEDGEGEEGGRSTGLERLAKKCSIFIQMRASFFGRSV